MLCATPGTRTSTYERKEYTDAAPFSEEHRSLQRLVALKVVSPQFSADDGFLEEPILGTDKGDGKRWVIL